MIPDGAHRGPATFTTASGSRGLTLLEVLIAVTMLAAIVVIAVAALRVGVRAWEAGEQRAASQQEIRAMTEIVMEALSGAYPYVARRGTSPERMLLFEGEADQVRLVTVAPPLALDVPAAFHAVVLAHSEDDGLTMRERLLPNDEPFDHGERIVLSRAVQGIRFAYLDGNGAWVERWDGRQTRTLPAAVRVELDVRVAGRKAAVPAFVVPLALGPRDGGGPGSTGARQGGFDR